MYWPDNGTTQQALDMHRETSRQWTWVTLQQCKDDNVGYDTSVALCFQPVYCTSLYSKEESTVFTIPGKHIEQILIQVQFVSFVYSLSKEQLLLWNPKNKTLEVVVF